MNVHSCIFMHNRRTHARTFIQHVFHYSTTKHYSLSSHLSSSPLIFTVTSHLHNNLSYLPSAYVYLSSFQYRGRGTDFGLTRSDVAIRIGNNCTSFGVTGGRNARCVYLCSFLDLFFFGSFVAI